MTMCMAIVNESNYKSVVLSDSAKLALQTTSDQSSSRSAPLLTIKQQQWLAS